MKSPWTSVLRSLALAALCTGMSSAATATYRYYRFRTTAVRGNVILVQLAEFKLFNGGVQVTGATATDPAPGNFPANEGPGNAVDGIVTPPTGGTALKWLDFDYNKGRLYLSFTAPTTIDSYMYYTANDSPERDPVSWVLEGTNDIADDQSWAPVDIRTNIVPPTTRYAAAATTNFIIPDALPAVIDEFDFSDLSQSMVVKNGSAVDFYADTSVATSSTLTSDGPESPTTTNTDAGTVLTVHPPANALTTYTLTANSAGGNATKSIKIRTVAGGTQSYRYVRFTPVAVTGGGQSINLNNFEFRNGATRVPAVSATSPAGTVVATQPISNLIDDPSAAITTWSSGNLAPVIFDLGTSPVTYDSYSFRTGTSATAGAPVKWYLEGSNDQTTWSLLDNVNYTYNTPTGTDAETVVLLSGASLTPYATVSTDVGVAAVGESVNLIYNILGATSGTIDQGVGAVGTSGTIATTASATKTYTISATSPNGVTSTGSTTLTVVPSIPASFTYANFDEHSAIVPTGATSFVNDFANFTTAGNVNRLRLTPTQGSLVAAAWYKTPVKVSDGFDTTFDAFVANKSTTVGADGMAFMIQNLPEGSSALNTNLLYIPGKTVTVALDSYPDQAIEVGKYATLQVFQGSTLLKLVDLTSTGPVGAGQNVAHGSAHNYLCDYNNAAANPYHVHVVYASGKLSVTIDSVLIIDSLAVDLSGVVDPKGRAYVGFTARTGGLSETHDVTAWSFTSAGAVATQPVVLTASAFNTTAHTVALTWNSNSGKSYRITQSPDLVNWTLVSGTGATVTASSASTSTTVNYTAGAAGFFRVEELP